MVVAVKVAHHLQPPGHLTSEYAAGASCGHRTSGDAGGAVRADVSFSRSCSCSCLVVSLPSELAPLSPRPLLLQSRLATRAQRWGDARSHSRRLVSRWRAFYPPHPKKKEEKKRNTHACGEDETIQYLLQTDSDALISNFSICGRNPEGRRRYS